ncbi:MAG: 3-oxoacid CoA-transferase [Synergistaceae bacterium]|nr:3-oxoacid CoA-transferase [Synergistaceae bacterium]
MKAKIISAREAAAMIEDGSTVAVGGFLGFGLAEEVLSALEQRYIEEKHPAGLTVTMVAGLGGDGRGRGINHFAHEGLVAKFFGSNMTLCPKMSALAGNNAFRAYMAPQGVMSHMMRAIAGGKPGVLTHVGLKTFCDPRRDGCKINDAAKNSDENVVELIHIGGEEKLFYPAFPIRYAIIKGTTADETGNISMEQEAVHIEQFDMAAAAHNCGGKVIAQVNRIVQSGTLPAKNVEVPGALVDYIVVGTPENSRQQYAVEEGYVPSWSGEIRIPLNNLERMKLNSRKVIARRVAMEIKEGAFVNLGIGVPTGVSNVLNEEGLSDAVTFSIESGATGGVPSGGLATGAAFNPEALIKQTDIFDYYDGGGIDLACLGGAEFDKYGNVNTSKFNGRVTGPGGFINITQNAKIVCFAGTFTAGKGGEFKIADGKLTIVKDSPFIKFHENVGHITFSGEYSAEHGKQKVFYITERAVFMLTREGMELTEIAPGVDLENDVLSKMEFKPIVKGQVSLMDARIFREENMGLVLKKT